MISEGLWKRRFGGDPSIVGRSLTLNGIDTTVVGIAPASLSPLSTGDMWIPLTIDPGREIRLNHVILAVGRLRPGVTLEQAQAEMDVVAGQVSRQYPEMKDWGIRLVDFYHVFVSPQLQTALVVLLARRRLRAADRVGERREPAAGARGVATEGDRRPHGDGRQPRTAAAATADREPRALRPRRRRRRDRRAVGRAMPSTRSCPRTCCRCPTCSVDLTVLLFALALDGRDRTALRHRAGVARREGRPERGA